MVCRAIPTLSAPWRVLGLQIQPRRSSSASGSCAKSMADQRAPSAVHHDMCWEGSIGRGECLECRPTVSRDGAEPCRAPSFAPDGPPVTSAYVCQDVRADLA